MRTHSTRKITWTLVRLLALLVVLFGLLGSAASAAPVRDLSELPSELRKYVPGTDAWAAAAWMTSPTCLHRGGDFSLWVTSVISDTPSLLAFFQPATFGQDVEPDDAPRSQAILDGYRALGSELATAVPAGYCVDDLRRWAGADPAMQPFGFPWGVTTGGLHRTGYYCTDREADAEPASELNRWFGAERLPCDGFYVSCLGAPEAEKASCDAWNVFSDSYVRKVVQFRAAAIRDYPATGRADTDSRLKTPDELLQDVAGNWFQEMAVNIAYAATSVMAEAMTFWTRSDQSSLLTSPAITNIQGMLRYVGLALLVGSMMWQGILMMYRRKLDPLAGTAMGLLSYCGWSTLAGSLAILLDSAGIALSDQVLGDTSSGFSETMARALQANVVTAPGAVFFLSIILFFLACIQWVLGFFRMGALVILLGLIPLAAAGQMNESTKPWLRKVLSWCLSLVLYKPVAAVVFSVGFTLMSDENSLSTILVGMAVLALAVVAMPTMLRFFDWGGQRLVSSGGGGGAMAAGAAASVLGGGGAVGFGRYMDQHGPAAGFGGGASSGAPPVAASYAGDGPAPGSRQGEAATATVHTGSTSSGATSGALVGSAPNAAVGAGTATSAAGGTAAGGTAAGGAAAGGAAAAAGPAGAAVVAAQVGKDTANRAAEAMSATMTDGPPRGTS